MIKQQFQQNQSNLFLLLCSFFLIPFAFLVLVVVVCLLAPIVKDQEELQE